MRTNTYQLFKMLHNVELNELKQAVRDFGGAAHFGEDYTGEGATGTERPIILVNTKYNGPQDFYINCVGVDDDNHLTIIGEPVEGYEDAKEVYVYDIEFGHISFITDLIPEKEKETRDNTQLIMETAVFMAWDMFDKMYKPEKGMGQFEVCHEIICLAKHFESTRRWKVDDEDYDEGKYFEELSKFEEEYLKNI